MVLTLLPREFNPYAGFRSIFESGQTTGIDNAAGKLVEFLLDSDCINFMVGAKLNQAHYNPALLRLKLKLEKILSKKMAVVLQDKYFKKVNVQYMQHIEEGKNGKN